MGLLSFIADLQANGAREKALEEQRRQFDITEARLNKEPELRATSAMAEVRAREEEQRKTKNEQFVFDQHSQITALRRVLKAKALSENPSWSEADADKYAAYNADQEYGKQTVSGPRATTAMNERNVALANEDTAKSETRLPRVRALEQRELDNDALKLEVNNSSLRNQQNFNAGPGADAIPLQGQLQREQSLNSQYGAKKTSAMLPGATAEGEAMQAAAVAKALNDTRTSSFQTEATKNADPALTGQAQNAAARAAIAQGNLAAGTFGTVGGQAQFPANGEMEAAAIELFKQYLSSKMSNLPGVGGSPSLIPERKKELFNLNTPPR